MSYHRTKLNFHKESVYFMGFCHNCNQEVSSKFCPDCGSEAVQKVEKTSDNFVSTKKILELYRDFRIDNQVLSDRKIQIKANITNAENSQKNLKANLIIQPSCIVVLIVIATVLHFAFPVDNSDSYLYFMNSIGILLTCFVVSLFFLYVISKRLKQQRAELDEINKQIKSDDQLEEVFCEFLMQSSFANELFGTDPNTNTNTNKKSTK